MLSLSLAMLFWSMDFYPGDLWVSASWRGHWNSVVSAAHTVCISVPLMWGCRPDVKTALQVTKNHSVLEWLLKGCHSSHDGPCCFQWQIDLGLLSTSPQAHGLCSQIFFTEPFLTFLKQNDKSLQMLLETSMGTLGSKTLLPQSLWNFWRSLKSSINYGFLKPCQNCKVSPRKAVWVGTWSNTGWNSSAHENVPVLVTGLVLCLGNSISWLYWCQLWPCVKR